MLCALLGLTVDTAHASVFGGFWLPFHTLPCDGGPRILRSILGERDAWISCEPFAFGSHWPGVSVVLGVQETLDLLGDDFRNFRIAGMFRVTFGRRLGQYYRGYGSGIARLVLLVPLFFFCRCQALTPCIMAGLDQINSYAVLDQGHLFPCCGAVAISMVGIPQLPYIWWSMLLSCSSASRCSADHCDFPQSLSNIGQKEG